MGAWVGPAIVAAVISSLVTAAGWYVAYVQERRREAARRRDRVRDIRTALLAEVRANQHRLRQIDLAAHADAIVARIEAEPGGAPYTPFVPREVPTFVFDALVAELHVLPTELIDPIVLYYRQVVSVAQLVEDIRSSRFEGLDAERKAAIYRDYVALLIHARSLADDAASALAADGVPGASSPASDPSVRRSA